MKRMANLNINHVSCAIKLFVKSGKDNTKTLSFVIHRVRLKKHLQKSTLAFKKGVKLRKPSILVVNLMSMNISQYYSISLRVGWEGSYAYLLKGVRSLSLLSSHKMSPTLKE
jgi:ABC-type enterochelin transport system ATPase subunit